MLQDPAQPAVILSCIHLNPRSLNGTSNCVSVLDSGFKNTAHSIGVVVSDTTIEMPTATLSVTANSRNNRPTIPPISKIGRNTAISEVLIESTVNPISRAPRYAACTGGMPFSMYRVMFSITTIASSTTNPSKSSAPSATNYPANSPADTSLPNVPINDSGTATLGISVAHTFRRNRTPSPKSPRSPRIAASVDIAHRRRIVVVRSTTTTS